MSPRPIAFRLLLLTLALAVPRLAAQTGQEDTIRFDYTVFAVDNSTPHGLFVRDERGRPRELEFNAKGRSQRYSHNGPPRFVVSVREPQPDQPDRFRPVAELDLPAAMPPDALIFFIPDRQNGFTLIWMNDTPRDFPVNSLRIFNATGTTLYTGVGENRLVLPVGASPAFPFPRSEDGRLPVGFAVQLGEDELHVVYANNLDPIPGNRTLLVVTPPRRSNSLRVRTWAIDEPIEPQDPEQTPDGIGNGNGNR